MLVKNDKNLLFSSLTSWVIKDVKLGPMPPLENFMHRRLMLFRNKLREFKITINFKANGVY